MDLFFHPCFRCVAWWVFGSKVDVELAGKKIRNAVCDYIEHEGSEHLELYDPVKYKSMKDYLLNADGKGLRNDRTWGTHLEILALAFLLGVCTYFGISFFLNR